MNKKVLLVVPVIVLIVVALFFATRPSPTSAQGLVEYPTWIFGCVRGDNTISKWVGDPDLCKGTETVIGVPTHVQMMGLMTDMQEDVLNLQMQIDALETQLEECCCCPDGS